MAKMVYDEWFGELTFAERSAIRKFNVSPFDHEQLCSEFGRENHAAITAAIKERSTSGMYREPSRW